MSRRWYYICLGIIFLGLIFRQPLLLLVSILGLLVLITTDIWKRYCLSDLHFRRELSERRVLFGEEITLSLAVENAKLLPLPWLEVEDAIPNALAIRGRRLRVNFRTNRTTLEGLFSPRWYERITRHYIITCNQRGVHTFGPTRLRSGDLFGFTERDETVENRQFLIVYPMIVPLSSFNLPAHYPFGDRRAPRRLLEDPSRVVGVRNYVYGDDLRRVHWKATARTLELQSKIYEPTTTYTLVLFLNVDNRFDTHFGIHPELQELAVCAAASVADWALDTGYAVGLYANSTMYMPEIGMQPLSRPRQETDNGETTFELTLFQQFQQRRIQIPPASNQEQRKHIMEALARIQTSFGKSMEDLLQEQRTHLPAGATVVMITGSVNDSLLETLVRLKQAGHAVTLLLVGDQPMSGKLAGIPIYYLGGEDTWNNLNACYNIPEDEEKSEQKREEVVTMGFQL